MTIPEALERFLTQLEADGRSAHTVRQYRRHVALFLRWAATEGPGGDLLASLDHQAIARFLASQAARTRPDGTGKKASSVNALRSSIRVFTAYLHRAGYLPEDPGRMVRRALCASGPPKALVPEDQDRLFAVLSGTPGPQAVRDYALFHLLLAAGVRLSAALGLSVEHLDLAGGELTVRTKGNRTERVFLGAAITSHLGRYVGERISGPLFEGQGGRPVSARHVQRRFAEWLKKAGIHRPVTCHGLRHAFATALYRKTRDILLVREALHHRSLTSTMVYARATAEDLRAALA